jgi:hypothetical protein
VWREEITFSFLYPCIHSQGVVHELCHIELDMNNPLVFFFVLSKIPELFDTVFIVLRKRPLRFLQYYHHIATMWFCWLACARKLESGGKSIYLCVCLFFHYVSLFTILLLFILDSLSFSGAFAVLNLTVHSVMYTYFGCAALHIRWPAWARLSITVMQVTQMLIGCCFVVIVFLSCFNDAFVMYFAAIMYISYLGLFGQLLYENCVGNSEQGAIPKKKIE